MSLKHAKFMAQDSRQAEDVIINFRSHAHAEATPWMGQMRVVSGRHLIATETGELFLEDGTGVSILLLGSIDDFSMPQPLYKFQTTGPFRSRPLAD